MALSALAKKTEHAGAKNSSHDKYEHRADLKVASRKHRRRVSKKLCDEAEKQREIEGGRG